MRQLLLALVISTVFAAKSSEAVPPYYFKAVLESSAMKQTLDDNPNYDLVTIKLIGSYTCHDSGCFEFAAKFKVAGTDVHDTIIYRTLVSLRSGEVSVTAKSLKE